MPLPSIVKGTAKRCTSLTKRSKERCQNPAAYGCRTCRMHGARKKDSIKRGEQHPNYMHGRRTLEATLKQSATSCRLQQLEDAMHLLGMTTAKRSRGRKANGYKRIKSVDKIKTIIKKS